MEKQGAIHPTHTGTCFSVPIFMTPGPVWGWSGLSMGPGQGSVCPGLGPSVGLKLRLNKRSFLHSHSLHGGLRTLPSLTHCFENNISCPWGTRACLQGPKYTHSLSRQGPSYVPPQRAMLRPPHSLCPSHHPTPAEVAQCGKYAHASLTGLQKYSKDSQPSSMDVVPRQGEGVCGLPQVF